jgi:hypothetical protein
MGLYNHTCQVYLIVCVLIMYQVDLTGGPDQVYLTGGLDQVYLIVSGWRKTFRDEDFTHRTAVR